MSLDDFLPPSPDGRANKFFFSDALGRRLALEKTLKGHRLCVNRITWNADGSMLISGSDDRRVCLHPYRQGNALPLSVITQHVSNIFGVQSLPFSSDRLLVSGAMDNTVQLHELDEAPASYLRNEEDADGFLESVSDEEGDDVRCVDVTPVTTTYMCHRGRVKDVKVDPSSAHLFWSVSEDGNIRQYDKRCSYDSQSRPESRNVLIGVLREGQTRLIPLKGLDINKGFPHQIAVACGDQFVRIYDRRKLDLGAVRDTFPEPVLSVAPPHLAMMGIDDDERCHTTYVNFSRRGDKVVALYHGDHAYSFDITSIGSTEAAYVPPSPTQSHHHANGKSEKWSNSNPEAAKKAREAEESKQSNISNAIHLLSEAIACAPACPTYYIERAGCFLKREVAGDVMMALRDADQAIALQYDQANAHVLRLQCLEKLGQRRTARNLLQSFLNEFSDMKDVKEVTEIRQKLSSKVGNGKRSINSKRTREEDDDCDSDGDVCLEDICEQGRSADPGAGTSESTPEAEDTSANDEFLFPHYCKKSTTSSDSPVGIWWNTPGGRRTLTRYVGQRNIQTDIKECIFVGRNDGLVACGSDDGSVFVYNSETGCPVNVLKADLDVANCVQCHPFESCLATSGIESVVRLWAPIGDSLNRSQFDSHLSDCIESMKRESRDDFLNYGRMLANIRMFLHDHRAAEDEIVQGDDRDDDDDDESEAETQEGSGGPCRLV